MTRTVVGLQTNIHCSERASARALGHILHVPDGHRCIRDVQVMKQKFPAQNYGPQANVQHVVSFTTITAATRYNPFTTGHRRGLPYAGTITRPG